MKDTEIILNKAIKNAKRWLYYWALMIFSPIIIAWLVIPMFLPINSYIPICILLTFCLGILYVPLYKEERKRIKNFQKLLKFK